uniref:Uncharacterized protein n=1 Tax=Arundo donax TaxID=35708 RepID=A0A0A9B403_ARUDO
MLPDWQKLHSELNNQPRNLHQK